MKWWSGEMAIFKIRVCMHLTLSTQGLSASIHGTKKLCQGGGGVGPLPYVNCYTICV